MYSNNWKGNKNPVISIYRKFPLLYIVSTVLTHNHAFISKSSGLQNNQNPKAPEKLTGFLIFFFLENNP